MPDQLQSIVERMVSAGESEDNIALVIKSYKPPTEPEKPKGDLGRFAGYKMIGDAVLNNPVKVGAMVGGLAAAPFTGGASVPAAMGIAGLGTAGGAGLGMAVDAARKGPSASAGQDIQTLLTEGALGALGQGVGGAVAKGLGSLAHRVYRGVLRPSQALTREFGDVAATGIREAKPVSAAGEAAVDAARGASAAEAKNLIAQAGSTAPRIRTLTEVGKETIPLVQRAGIRTATGLPDEAPAIVGRVRAMQQANPGGIPLDRAQAMKHELQERAASVYRAQDRGAPVTDLGADTDAALARGLRGAIESRVPGVRDANQRTQELIGLQRAMENANARNVSIGIKSLIGDMTPGLVSGAAIGLDRAAPTTAPLLRALITALGGGDR